ncbi:MULTISPECIES: SH3 domain-containing protein [unclassified Streptomyces]|uniref:SH3 domain-containing protein n=1 Tax=Streptomyces TaxID=1883 RepID=UPI00081EC93C|nr:MULTISPECIES: SH3 domain-containing protein [unclassified Streptomyces]OSC56810.1 SH3 domain-containing protein [Streptomyces sp. BF-3]UCA48258.1 SH3 domain-containing protein [Streptomyces sp. WA6-1-16]SCF71877.1 SH3 domain-containing protein [Streptomyces sp. Cmuel-A718b]
MGVEEHTQDRAAAEGVATAENASAAGEIETTASGTRYPIAPGYRVNVRTGPGTDYRIVRTLPYGQKIPIYCQKPGERVTGPYGTSNLWDNIANGQFVSDAYVYTGRDGYIAPRCD